MVTSSDGSTFTVTNYQWNTTRCYTHPAHNGGNPSCFPTGLTTQNVTGNNLLAEDAGTITCAGTVAGVDYTSGPLMLHISGIRACKTRYHMCLFKSYALNIRSFHTKSTKKSSPPQISLKMARMLGP